MMRSLRYTYSADVVCNLCYTYKSMWRKRRIIVNFTSMTQVDSIELFKVVTTQNFVIYHYFCDFFVSSGKSIFQISSLLTKILNLNAVDFKPNTYVIKHCKLRHVWIMMVTCLEKNSYIYLKISFLFFSGGLTRKIGGQFKNSVCGKTL